MAEIITSLSFTTNPIQSGWTLMVVTPFFVKPILLAGDYPAVNSHCTTFAAGVKRLASFFERNRTL